MQNQPVLGGDEPGLGVRVGGEKSARWATERLEKAEMGEVQGIWRAELSQSMGCILGNIR